MTPDDYEDAYGLADEPNCMTCCGDGFEECTDPLCELPGHMDGWHRCPNCHGSGLAKDQRFW